MQARRQFASTIQSSGTQHVTNADFHNRIERRRQDESTLSSMNQYRAADSLLRATAESEKRVDNLRRVKDVQSRQQNELADSIFESELRHRQEQFDRRKQDESLARAMHQISIEEQSKGLVNRRVCEESPELQELKSLLNAAATSNARQIQIQQKKSLQQQDNDREREIARIMEEERLLALKIIQEKDKLSTQANIETRNAMQGQIHERLERKKAAYEENLREKAVIDQIVADIQKEDVDKIKAQNQRRVELQKSISDYLYERESWRKAEKKRAEQELVEIQKYQELQEKRLEEMRSKKQIQNAQQDAVLQRMSEDILRKRKEQEEIEQLLMELYAEEHEQRALEAIRDREMKVQQMKQDMIVANELQKRMKYERELEAAEEDKHFREQMMNKFAEDHRLELMNQQKRRMEMERYRREVDKAVDERRKQRELQLLADLQDIENEKRRESERLVIVEEERRRLLRENAHLISKYGLPKGIVKSSEDYKLLFGDDVPYREPSYGIKNHEYVDYDLFR